LRYLTENRDSTIKRLLLGNTYTPRIKTFGIITAENPMGDTSTPTSYNKRAMRALKKDLNELRSAFVDIVGYYGQRENSLIVLNISLEDMQELAIEYAQESFIFAEVTPSKIYYELHFAIDGSSDNGHELTQLTDVKINIKEPPQDERGHSVYNDHIFRIPFFQKDFTIMD